MSAAEWALPFRPIHAAMRGHDASAASMEFGGGRVSSAQSSLSGSGHSPALRELPREAARMRTQVGAAPATVPPIPEMLWARRDGVPHARTDWKQRLTDTSRRNNLLCLRALKVGTLDMTSVLAAAMEPFLQEEPVAFKEFFGREIGGKLAKSLREIRSRAMVNFEARGLKTLYLAVGIATWTAVDGGRDVDRGAARAGAARGARP